MRASSIAPFAFALLAPAAFAAGKEAKPPPVVHLEVPQNNDRVEALALSPDGKLLAALDQKHVRIFDLEAGTLVRSLQWSPSEMLGAVVFSKDGKHVFVGGYDTKGKDDASVHLRQVDVKTGKVDADFPAVPNQSSATSLAVSPDGKTVLFSNGTVCGAYEIAGGKLAWKQPEPQGGAVAFSPDGKVAVCGGGFAKASRHFQVLDATNGTPLKKVAIVGERVNSLSFSADGKLLAIGANGVKQIEVFDTATWAVAKTFDALGNGTRAAFSSDGKWLAAPGKDAVVNVYDVASGGKVATSTNPGHFGAFTPSVFALAWNGGRLLKAGWGGVDVLDSKGAHKASLLSFSDKGGDDDWVAVTADGAYACSANAEKRWIKWWTKDGSIADQKYWPKDKKNPGAVKAALK